MKTFMTLVGVLNLFIALALAGGTLTGSINPGSPTGYVQMAFIILFCGLNGFLLMKAQWPSAPGRLGRMWSLWLDAKEADLKRKVGEK